MPLGLLCEGDQCGFIYALDIDEIWVTTVNRVGVDNRIGSATNVLAVIRLGHGLRSKTYK